MIGRLLLLIGGSMAFWLVAALPVRLLGGGDAALVDSATALLLCLLPGVGTLAWAEWARRHAPGQIPVAVLGGTVARMVFVLGVGLLVYFAVPFYRHAGYWVWLLIAYLFTLALEIGLFLSGGLAGSPAPRERNADSVGRVKS